MIKSAKIQKLKAYRSYFNEKSILEDYNLNNI